MNTNLPVALGMPTSDATLAQSDPAVLLGITKQTSSSTHTKKTNLPEESFSALLAQQIVEVGTLAENMSPISVAADTAVTSVSDKKTLQNKPELSSETNIVNNSTDPLAAIMLQLQAPMSNVYVKDTPQDKETVLPGEIPASSVNSRSYPAKNGDDGFNPRAEGYLKNTMTDSLSSDNNPDAPLVSKESTNTGGLHQSTLTRQSEEPSTGIATGLSAMENSSSLYAGEANQNIRETKEIRANKSTDKPIKTDALNQSDTTIPAASTKPQSESPLTSVAIEPPRNKEANISTIVQTKDSPNTPSINTASLSTGTLQGNTTNYLSTNLAQTISSPLGTDKWSNEFSQKIVWMCTQQNQVAELHLNPADLGPLNVTLKISNDQLTAQFTSPHLAVREAIESAIPKLREILADSGIQLNNASVGDQSPRDRGAGGYNDPDSRPMKQPEIPGNTASAMAFTNSKTPLSPSRRHHGILDTFA